MPKKNANLHNAKIAKNDEFYTQLCDIENELRHYKEHLRWKTVLCNCDDPKISNFFHYFAYNFEHLWLKRLITTCYKNQNPDLFSQYKSEKAVYLIYDWDKNWNNIPDPSEIWIHALKWDWDFRSEECIELLKQADVVVTNPPFSLFREYITQLVKYNKDFLIIGNMNGITYKEVFPLIKENKLWTWYKHFWGWMDMIFPKNLFNPEKVKKYTLDNNWNYIVNIMWVIWYTNLDISKRHENLILYKKYSKEEYPEYDHYYAINVDKVSDIPCDYDWVMWVPITFLDKYSPSQFEILWTSDNWIIDDKYKRTPGLTKKFVDDYYRAWWTGSYKEWNPTAWYYDKNNIARMSYKRLFIRRKK